MSIATQSDAAAARPLELRARADLVLTPISFRGRRYWSVKDPSSLRFYQLCDEEHFILQQLDGTASLRDVQTAFEARFAPRQLQRTHLHAFLSMLHHEGLATTRASGQGEHLLERHRESERKQLLQRFSNLLAIRFRGVDPDAFLSWAYPAIRWLFSLPVVTASALLMLAAVALVVTQFDAVFRRLPSAFAMIGVENLLLLAAVLAVCKVLHELGHAFACKHFGGECHELGLMFLVFAPCLYCNVSDAWMIPSKWRRIAISAAGIYIELLLAAICTFLWWFSQPGLVNTICLNVMLVCSVSTLFFNGNPLLRYDGYFILADLIERPNLRQQAEALLYRIVRRTFTGQEPESSWIVPKDDRLLLAAYGIASFAYRWLVIGTILFFVHRALEPHRLEVIAQSLAVLIVVGAVGPMMWQATQNARKPSKPQRARWLRPSFVFACLVAIFAGLCFLPISRSVRAPVVLEPANATRVRSKVAGQLLAHVRYGQLVSESEPIAELSNADVDQKVVALRGERDVWRQQVQHIERLRVRDRQRGVAGVGSQLLTAKEALAATERQLAQAVRDQQDFRIAAPLDGIILPPRNRLEQSDELTLPLWSGRPLDDCNAGCFVDADTVLCMIGDPNDLKGTVLVAQHEVERIRVGQPVEILLDEFPNRALLGKIDEIARLDADRLPRELTQKQMLAAVDDEASSGTSREVYYSVSVSVEPQGCVPPLWSSGRARIGVAPRTLGQIVYEQLCKTFRIDL